MQWIINNVKMLIVIFLLSLLLNIGLSTWIIKQNNEIDQISHRMETLANIANHKEKALEKARTAERKFFSARPLPQGTGKGYNSSNAF